MLNLRFRYHSYRVLLKHKR